MRDAIRLAKVLKDVRWARKLTVREMAKEMGISYSKLNRFEDERGDLSGDVLAKVLCWLLSKEPF